MNNKRIAVLIAFFVLWGTTGILCLSGFLTIETAARIAILAFLLALTLGFAIRWFENKRRERNLTREHSNNDHSN